MPYIILARKYRPQDFDEVIGQDHITKILKSAVSQNRLAQAYLFSGPRGVGKTSMARILAKSLNCTKGPTLKPCQKCSNCIEINQGRSLDCLEIDGASNRGIDEIRTLRENIKFSPSSGKFKIYIIDEVHMLTQEAFNALLKTLEEPPEHVKFIFATTQPQKVISTILSRCQKFDFRTIPILKIIEKLQKIAELEKIKISKDALFVIAKEASGSIRDAESILDQVTSLSKEKISIEDVNSLLGTLEYDFLFNVSDKIIKKDAQRILTLINDFINQGKDITLLFSALLEHIRNLTLSKFFKNVQASYLDLPLDIKERLIDQAANIDLKNLLSIFDIILNYQGQAKYSEFPQIILEIMAIKLTLNPRENVNPPIPPQIKTNAVKRPAVNVGPKSIPQQPNNDNSMKLSPVRKISFPNGANADSKKTKAITKQEIKQKPIISLEAVKEKWSLILEEISKIKMSVSTYLKDAVLLGIDKNILKLGFSKKLSFHKESLEHKENRLVLEEALNKHLDAGLKIKFETTSQEHKENNPDLEPLREKDTSIIRSALDVFRGKLVD